MDLQVLIVLLTGVSGLFGILLTQSYSKNQALRSELKNKKQRLYSDFISFIYPIYTGSGTTDGDTTVVKLKEYIPKLLSFASNEVIKSTGDFMQHIYKYNQVSVDSGDTTWNIASMEYFGDLMIAIRNDLGHKKFTQIMKWHDIARIWITDIDCYVPKNEQTPRSYHPGPKPAPHNK